MLTAFSRLRRTILRVARRNVATAATTVAFLRHEQTVHFDERVLENRENVLQDVLLVLRLRVLSRQSVASHQEPCYLKGLVNKGLKLDGCGHWKLLVRGHSTSNKTFRISQHQHRYHRRHRPCHRGC